MGQILIDIPSNKTRRFLITTREQADVLLKVLEDIGIPVKANPARLSRQKLEDLQDYRDGKKALEEMRRTGVSFTVDELREKYGLVLRHTVLKFRLPLTATYPEYPKPIKRESSIKSNPLQPTRCRSE